MIKKLVLISLTLNSFFLVGAVLNLMYVTNQAYQNIEHGLDAETTKLANQSITIIDSYSEEERIDNIEKIIGLYKKIVIYIDPLEKYFIESSEAIIQYSIIILLAAILNIIFLFFIYGKLGLNPK